MPVDGVLIEKSLVRSSLSAFGRFGNASFSLFALAATLLMKGLKKLALSFSLGRNLSCNV